MQKQKKQMIAVIVVLILFAGAYIGMHFFNEKQAEKETAKEEAEKIYVTDVSEKDIKAFSYQNGNETLSFTKNKDTWTSENDDTLDMDENTISTMLGNITKLEAEEKMDASEDLSEYGFDTPTNVITFTTDSKTTTLVIGMKNDITGQYYVKKDDEDTLYLVSAAMPNAFEKALEDLVVEDTETEAVTE